MAKSDRDYLLTALKEAETRRGYCAPNPSVGAVVVKNGNILAQGHHKKAGLPHAEVEALTNLGGDAEGSTVYVTLEPCCHTGKKTPPCTDLLKAKKVARVVYGYQDPNPKVAGNGEKILRDSGILCEYLKTPELDEYYTSYSYWTRTGLPAVTAKLALSLDGKISGPNGVPVKLTSGEIDLCTQEQRLHSDAILTTAKTILRDNPRLNARVSPKEVGKKVFILDSRLETPLDAKVLTHSEKVILFHSKSASPERVRAWQEKNIELLVISETNHQLDLVQVIQAIGANGAHDLWVEAGGTLIHELMRKNLVSRALFYVTPHILGPDATPGFSAAVSNCITSGTKVQWRTYGPDACMEIRWPARS